MQLILVSKCPLKKWEVSDAQFIYIIIVHQDFTLQVYRSCSLRSANLMNLKD